MEIPATAAPPRADTPRARRIRLVGIVALAVSVAAISWLSLRQGGRADDPAEVYDYIRDRTLAGDGEAMWRRLSPRAREGYVKFLHIMQEARDGEGTSIDRDEWRRKMGLSKEELRKLPPDKVMARENLASAEEFFRGSRVYKVDRWDEETAYLHILMRSGHDRFWVVQKVDGAWRVDNLWPALTQQGTLLPREGEELRKVPTAIPDDAVGGNTVAPGGR